MQLFNSKLAWSLFLHFTTVTLDLSITKTSKISNSNILFSEYNSLAQNGIPFCSLSLQAVTTVLTSLHVIFPFKMLHRHWPHFTSWNIQSSILPQGISTCNLFLVCDFSCSFQVWLLLLRFQLQCNLFKNNFSYHFAIYVFPFLLFSKITLCLFLTQHLS